MPWCMDWRATVRLWTRNECAVSVLLDARRLKGMDGAEAKAFGGGWVVDEPRRFASIQRLEGDGAVLRLGAGSGRGIFGEGVSFAGQ